MNPALRIVVRGNPAPQGSKRHVGNGVLIESSKKVKPWREAIRWAVIEAGRPMIHGPVRVDIVFTLARPRKYARASATEVRPAVRPDGDKLTRAVWDALVGAGAIEDDSRVVAWSGAKYYAGSAAALNSPGAVIQVLAMERV